MTAVAADVRRRTLWLYGPHLSQVLRANIPNCAGKLLAICLRSAAAGTAAVRQMTLLLKSLTTFRGISIAKTARMRKTLTGNEYTIVIRNIRSIVIAPDRAYQCEAGIDRLSAGGD